MLIVAIGLLILLGVGGLVLSVIRAQRQNALDRTLIAAILRNDTKTALHALDAGADANARVQPDLPLLVWRLAWNQLRGVHPQNRSDTALVALLDGWIPHQPSACTHNWVPDQNAIIAASLLRHGARVNVSNGNGYPPLTLATLWNYQDTVFLLLSHGANPNAGNSSGWGALIFATWSHNPTLTKALLDAGADPEQHDEHGNTVLCRVCRNLYGNGDKIQEANSIVRLLLAHHADVHVRFPPGITLLAAARAQHAWAIVTMLEAAGAKE